MARPASNVSGHLTPSGSESGQPSLTYVSPAANSPPPRRFIDAASAAEVDEDGLDAAVLGVVAGEGELVQDVADVRLDGGGRDPESFRDRAVGEAFGHQREHLPFPLGQLAERVGVAPLAQE